MQYGDGIGYSEGVYGSVVEIYGVDALPPSWSTGFGVFGWGYFGAGVFGVGAESLTQVYAQESPTMITYTLGG